MESRACIVDDGLVVRDFRSHVAAQHLHLAPVEVAGVIQLEVWISACLMNAAVRRAYDVRGYGSVASGVA